MTFPKNEALILTDWAPKRMMSFASAAICLVRVTQGSIHRANKDGRSAREHLPSQKTNSGNCGHEALRIRLWK